MTYAVPSVVQRHGSRTAIILEKGRSLLHVVELTGSRLLLKKYGEEELQAFGYKPTNYDVVEAAKKYLQHNAGVTPNARAALEELIENAFLL